MKLQASAPLLQPSIHGNYGMRTQSYRLPRLFFPALIGGIVALTILGYKNAVMLKTPWRIRAALIVSSVLMLAVQIGIYAADYNELFGYGGFTGLLTLRGPDLMLFAIYYQCLKRYYRIHMVFNGEIRYFWKEGLAWIVLSIFVDGLLFG